MLKSKKRGIGDVARYTSGPARPPSFGQEPDDDAVISGLWFGVVVIVGFVIIAFLAVRFGTANIEADLEARASRALAAAGYEDVTVEAIGTSIRLSGSISQEQTEEDAYAVVLLVPAVGDVSGALWPVANGELEEIIVTGEAIDFTWDGESVTVAGSISTEERITLVEETLATSFSREVDVEGLTTLEGLADESAWLGPTLALVRRFSDALPTGRVVADPTYRLLTVVGETEDKALRDELNEFASETGAGFGFDVTTGVRLLVVEVPPTEEEVEELQVNLDDLIEGKVVEFEVKSYELTPEGAALLDEISDALETVPNVRVRIAGYTDSQGSHEDNQILSELRAQAVLEYLVARGAERDRFEVIGLGEADPVADNNTAEGRARNRRIEFTALLEEG
jgi:outer membrane protein OmpA-like peptidoglycan-associated protein